MTSRKNWTMRAAVLMLALVLITSCFVGGTFAKYVTGESGSDTARVAKFGVNITANGTTFAKEYKTDDPEVSGTITKSVISSTDENLVAPGTKGEMVKMQLSGKPEVAVNVKYTANKIKLTGWTLADDSFYCPLVFKVNNDTIDGKDYTSATELENAIKTAIEGYSKNYAPNQDLTKVKNDSLAFSWEWPFSTTNDDNTNNDAKDTYLGDQAADNNASTVAIEIATTVTQID